MRHDGAIVRVHRHQRALRRRHLRQLRVAAPVGDHIHHIADGHDIGGLARIGHESAGLGQPPRP